MSSIGASNASWISRDDPRRLQRFGDAAHDRKALDALGVEIAALVVVQLALAGNAVEHRRRERQMREFLGDVGRKHVLQQIVAIGRVERPALGDGGREGSAMRSAAGLRVSADMAFPVFVDFQVIPSAAR